MMGRALVLAWAVTAAVVGCSPATPRPVPERRGDAAVVEPGVGHALDDYLARAARFGFSGTVLVAVDDRIVLHRGYGFANLARKQRNDTSTVFDIGSITKTLTAGAILLLESEGKLSRSDSIRRFFPEAPADKHAITIEHLLTHTSGLIDPPLGDYEPIGRDALMALVFERPLGSPPGTTYNYSNAGFSMLAAIIEKISGQPYEAFMRARIFGPAGMAETGYRLPGLDPARVAHTYTYPVDHGSPLDRLRKANGPGWILVGNGGLLGTTGDLYRWEKAFRAGTIIPADKVMLATTARFTRGPRSAVGYDWAIEVGDDGERAYHHSSDAPYVGLNGLLGRYPSLGATIVVLANNRWNGASTRHFVVRDLRKILGRQTVALPPTVPVQTSTLLEAARGVFASGEATLTVRSSGDGLEIGVNGQAGVDLFNLRQGDDAVVEARRLNDRAGLFLRRLQEGNAHGLAGFLGDAAEVADFLAGWRRAIATNGRYLGGQVLGTYRLDRRGFLTTVRLDFASGARVARFSWQRDKVTASSEDLFLEPVVGPLMLSPVPYAVWQPCWYAGPTQLFTFDVLTGTSLEAQIETRNGKVEAVTFRSPGGTPARFVRAVQ